VDSETDWQLWAERYDGALRGIFAVHDEITMRVVGGTEPHLYEEDELRGRAGA
jgi:TolB-like protein